MSQKVALSRQRADEDFRLVVHSAAHGLSQMVLRADIAGMPLEWIDYREAARLYHQEQVAYTCGSLVYRLYGGINARSGKRTGVGGNSIVAAVGHTGNPGNTPPDQVPPPNNAALFRRAPSPCLNCCSPSHGPGPSRPQRR